MAAKHDLSALESYPAEYDLIPLHRWDFVDSRKRQRGKSPRDNDWRNKKYARAEVLNDIARGNNVGVRLGDEDLVLDADPRNYPEGRDCLTEFAKALDLDLSKYPHVQTGSGGSHYYMKKPKGVKLRDSLEDYPGIEFKSLGRQVVAAGSVHPNGKLYEHDFLGVEFPAPMAPDPLIALIRRPAVQTSSGGGEHTPEELARMLDGLDAEEYREHQPWLDIMMACHHATAGEGRQEFIEWSTRDPNYSDQAWIIGRRWDSLHVQGKQGGTVTYKTLHKALRLAGKADHIPRAPASDDFADEGAEAPPPVEQRGEELGPLEKLNKKFCAVMEDGQFTIYSEQLDPSFKTPRKRWVRYKTFDFEKMHENKRVQKGNHTENLAKAWISWPGRRFYEGVLFDPESDHKGWLNLWTGWSVEPKQGSWDYLKELLFESLVDRDDRAYEYVLNWMADLVQRPGNAAEVAICFQGTNGTGKGTLGRALSSLAGRHGLHITSPEHLTGRFNSHLRDVVMLFADEAVSPYDAAATSRLKGLITEQLITFEGKGQNAYQGRNLIHVMMASNESWFVPIELDGERRFFVSRVETRHKGNTAFFDALNAEMYKNGGLSAMLWDLLRRDVSKWRPRDAIPATAASVEQKVRSLSPLAQWWFNVLSEGRLPFEAQGDWNQEDPLTGIAVKAFKNDVRVAFEDFCRRSGIRSGAANRSNETLFGMELGNLMGANSAFSARVKVQVPDHRPDVTAHSDGRAWGYAFPSLYYCRQAMKDRLGGSIAW